MKLKDIVVAFISSNEMIKLLGAGGEAIKKNNVRDNRFLCKISSLAVSCEWHALNAI